MLAVPGGLYKVRLNLSGPVGTDPSWLVGAIRATWGGMEVVNMRRSRKDQVVVTVRPSRRANLNVGDSVHPITQGISVPGLELPSATVEQVEPSSLPAPRSGLPFDPTAPTLSDEGDAGWGLVDLGKLGLSAVLIGTTVWLSRRIKA